MPNQPIVNAITIDLEDWVQSVYDPSLPLTNLFIRNTHRVLDLLDTCKTRATFFVLGLAAEKAPHLIQELVARGHEVQSHGFSHVPVYRQDRAAFRADITRSKGLLEDIIGREITGYRAPQFSVVPSTLWALDVLREVGFTCDSSIFPMRMRRYGISGAPISPHYRQTSGGERILEAPVAVIRHGPLSLPAGGGGYFRLWPYAVIRHCIASLDARGFPAVIYLHPYEFAPEEFAELPMPIPRRLRLHQSTGRASMAEKVTRLVRDFRFGTVADALCARANWPSIYLTSSRDTSDGNYNTAPARVSHCGRAAPACPE